MPHLDRAALNHRQRDEKMKAGKSENGDNAPFKVSQGPSRAKPGSYHLLASAADFRTRVPRFSEDYAQITVERGVTPAILSN
jgi:hypothetical protein